MSTPKISKMQKRLNTKKSEREPLGKKLQPNTFWDDLNKLYIQVYDSATKIGYAAAEGVDKLISDEEKRKFITDETKLTNYILMIDKDINEYHRNLNELYEQHKNRRGGTGDDPDLHMLALTIFGKYNDVTSIFDSNLNEYIQDLSKELDDIETRYNNRNSINNVIDAEFKMDGGQDE